MSDIQRKLETERKAKKVRNIINVWGSRLAVVIAIAIVTLVLIPILNPFFYNIIYGTLADVFDLSSLGSTGILVFLMIFIKMIVSVGFLLTMIMLFIAFIVVGGSVLTTFILDKIGVTIRRTTFQSMIVIVGGIFGACMGILILVLFHSILVDPFINQMLDPILDILESLSSPTPVLPTQAYLTEILTGIFQVEAVMFILIFGIITFFTVLFVGIVDLSFGLYRRARGTKIIGIPIDYEYFISDRGGS